MLSQMRRFGLAVGLSLLSAISACHIALVSDYDDTFDQELTATQKDMAALFDKIITNVSAQNSRVTAEIYSEDSAAISKVHTDISGLTVRAAAHTGEPEDLSNVKKFAHSFADFENEYAKPPALDIVHAQDEEQILNDELTVMMKQELLKKQGKSTNGGSPS
jgi:hypothetical protein